MSTPPINWDDVADGYRRTIGEVPESLAQKIELHRRTGSQAALLAIESARAMALERGDLPQSTVQLLQFGMCAVQHMTEGARIHARSARNHGVSLKELLDAARVAFVVGGIPAFNSALTAIADAFPGDPE